MRTRLLFYAVLILAFFVGRPVFAQSNINNSHQKTSTPPDARYDVIQSQLAAKWTFRLDRFTGRVWQLVKTQNDENTWEAMIVERLPAITNPNKSRFLIFTSGLAARHTFLMDSQSGKTWIVTAVEVPLGEGKTETINVWKPFKE